MLSLSVGAILVGHKFIIRYSLWPPLSFGVCLYPRPGLILPLFPSFFPPPSIFLNNLKVALWRQGQLMFTVDQNLGYFCK